MQLVERLAVQNERMVGRESARLRQKLPRFVLPAVRGGLIRKLHELL
jgi:hypothetical protein